MALSLSNFYWYFKHSIVITKNLVLIGKWSYSSIIDNGVSSQHIGILHCFVRVRTHTLLEFCIHYTTKDHKRHASKAHKWHFPIEVESKDHTSDNWEECLEAASQATRYHTIDCLCFSSHSRWEHTWSVIFVIKPSDVFGEDWGVKVHSHFQGYILTNCSKRNKLIEWENEGAYWKQEHDETIKVRVFPYLFEVSRSCIYWL